jgi:hypothetical protein
VLRRIFGPKRDEVTGGWRKLHEELHNLYSSSSIIKTTKSRIKWPGHIGCMGRRGMYIGFWWEGQKERDHQEDQDADGRIGKFLNSCTTGDFSRRAQLHGVSYIPGSFNGPFNISNYIE